MSDAFSKFKEYSVAEFFTKNRQMLGFSGKVRSLTTIVHEYITNSLDACEEAGIMPEIEVWVENAPEEKVRVKVRDNGPGIPKSHIGRALGVMLAGSKFNRYMQQRGQQGIGATGCTMFSLITTGQHVKVVSDYGGKRVKADIGIDFKSNKAVLTEVVEGDSPEGGRGLYVDALFGDVKYEKSSKGVHEYLRRTALANPHATIIFNDPEGARFEFPRSVEQLPPRPFEVKPHPLGLGAHDLLEMSKRAGGYSRLSAFMQNELARVSLNKVKELQELVPDVDLGMKPDRLNWEQAERIVRAFQKVKWIAPATNSVIPIGKGQVEKSLNNILGPEFVYVTERPPKIYRGGIPFTVEVGIAYGGQKPSPGGELMRFANRAPLLFDAGGCAITATVKNIDWKRYNIRNFDDEPLTLFINFSSVHVPYTSAGKQSISDEEEVVDEIRNAVQESLRNVGRHLSGKRREKEKGQKRKVIMRYVGQLSSDLADLADEGEKEGKLKETLTSIIERRFE